MDLDHLFVSCVVATFVLGATYAPAAIFLEKYLSYDLHLCFGLISASSICAIVLIAMYAAPVFFEGRVVACLAFLFSLAMWICVGIWEATAARLRRARSPN
jgi:hypothetical protein